MFIFLLRLRPPVLIRVARSSVSTLPAVESALATVAFDATAGDAFDAYAGEEEEKARLFSSVPHEDEVTLAPSIGAAAGAFDFAAGSSSSSPLMGLCHGEGMGGRPGGWGTRLRRLPPSLIRVAMSSVSMSSTVEIFSSSFADVAAAVEDAVEAEAGPPESSQSSGHSPTRGDGAARAVVVTTTVFVTAFAAVVFVFVVVFRRILSLLPGFAFCPPPPPVPASSEHCAEPLGAAFSFRGSLSGEEDEEGGGGGAEEEEQENVLPGSKRILPCFFFPLESSSSSSAGFGLGFLRALVRPTTIRLPPPPAATAEVDDTLLTDEGLC
mmetsp:Transcript_40853/g.123087  ORF Transcript_40853/g.123087 Transcript_40853/m.123087 type:complete len:324 (+) Transcript_40853:5449-6420(+)